jgi:hypothetical protein
VSIWNGVNGVNSQVVDNLKVNSNIIQLSEQSASSEGGIVPGTLEGPITNSSFDNNNITQLGSLAANGRNPKGIFLAWAEDCSISGNKLYGLAGKGIEVSNSSTNRAMKRIKIHNNQIRDIGLGGVVNNDYAIQAKGLNASFVAFDISIHNNQITGNYGSAIVIEGYVNGPNVQGNSVKPSDINPVKFVNPNASNAVEENNWVEKSASQPASGYYLNGKVILNNAASILGTPPNTFIIDGWRKLNSGSTNVAGVDWVERRIYTNTP